MKIKSSQQNRKKKIIIEQSENQNNNSQLSSANITAIKNLLSPNKDGQTVKKQNEDTQTVKSQNEDTQTVKKQNEDAQTAENQNEDAQTAKNQNEDTQTVKKQNEDAQTAKNQNEENQNTEKENINNGQEWTQKKVSTLYEQLSNLLSQEGESFNSKLPKELRDELYNFYDTVEIDFSAQNMTFKIGNTSITGKMAEGFYEGANYSRVVYNPSASGPDIKELARCVMFSGHNVLEKFENYANKYGEWQDNKENAKISVKNFIADLKNVVLNNPQKMDEFPVWIKKKFKKSSKAFVNISQNLEDNLNIGASYRFALSWTQDKINDLVKDIDSDNVKSDLLNEWTLINFIKNLDVDCTNTSGLAFKMHINNKDINITGNKALILHKKISKYARVWFNPIFARDGIKTTEDEVKLALKCVAFNSGYRELRLSTDYGEKNLIKSPQWEKNSYNNLLKAEKVLESKELQEKIVGYQPWAKDMLKEFTWTQERINKVFNLLDESIQGNGGGNAIKKEDKEISTFINNLVILGNSNNPQFLIGCRKLNKEHCQKIINLKKSKFLLGNNITFDINAKDKQKEALRCTTLSPDIFAMHASLNSHFSNNDEKVNEVLISFLAALIDIENNRVNILEKYKSWVTDSYDNYIESIKKHFNVDNLKDAKQKLSTHNT